MKKIGMTAFAILLLCVLTGCPTDDGGKGGGKTPASMTFVDNLDNPAKEFTIDENLGFKVTFINPGPTETGLTIQQGDSISGKITQTDTAWNNDLTGVAEQMTAKNPTFAGAMPGIKVTISLTYTKVEDVITDVTLVFQGDDTIGLIAGQLMGGTYYLKK
jgi:hypothetical protein